MREAWLGVAVSILVVSTARAQQAPPSADEHFERGLVHYNTQEFEQAAVEFKAAYQLDPRPVFLYSLGQAHRKAGDCASAVDAFRSYLRTEPAEQQAKKAEANVERCEQMIEAARQKAKAEVASKPPPPRERVVVVPERVELVRGPWYRDTLGNALAVAGVVSLGVGGAALYVGESRLDDAASEPTLEDADAAQRSGARLRKVAIGGFVAGGALITASAFRYYMRPSRLRRLSVSAAPTAGGGATFVIGGRF